MYYICNILSIDNLVAVSKQRFLQEIMPMKLNILNISTALNKNIVLFVFCLIYKTD